jgi:pyroglutamyl-peptidase
MKILFTGFEPFENSTLNPSQEVLNHLDSESFVRHVIKTCLLPVDTMSAPNILLRKIDEVSPDIVICLGQATGRSSISLEKVAINQLDFRIPDNQGNQVHSKVIEEYGQDAYFASLPLELLHECLSAAGIPCEISFSAGTYLCNQVFYTLMHHIRSDQPSILGGFLHFPALPQQVVQAGKNLPSMSLEMDLNAIHLIIGSLSDVLDPQS